jgi:hypothetical protein
MIALLEGEWKDVKVYHDAASRPGSCRFPMPASAVI